VSSIKYFPHASFIVGHRDTRLLNHPWSFAALLESWFPYPMTAGCHPADADQLGGDHGA